MNATPLWKIKLVQESLKYMMTDEDQGGVAPEELEAEEDMFDRDLGEDNLFKASFKQPQKASAPEPIKELRFLVKEADRLKSADVVQYLQALLKAAKVVQDPKDDIGAIFDKINTWKKKFGNLDEQEKAVSKKMKTAGVDIHNVKTLTLKMKELQKEIGLSNDDIVIIIYTSLDLDWFTNMLV